MSIVSGPVYLCTDINTCASKATVATGAQNKVTASYICYDILMLILPQVPLESIVGSLAAPFQHRLSGSVDVLIFNPPYVPTMPEEAHQAQQTMDILGSWAGGTDGMQVTDIFLPIVPVGFDGFDGFDGIALIADYLDSCYCHLRAVSI